MRRTEWWAASEEHFQAALDALPDPVLVLAACRDPAGTLVDLQFEFVNAATCRLYRLPAEQVVGQTQLALFPATRDSDLWRGYLEVLESGRPASIAVRQHDDHGVRHDLVVRAARLDDGLIITARDVTEQVRVDDQRRHERELLRHERDFNRATLDVAGVVIVVLDGEWRIVRFNRQAEVLSGYREHEVLGRHYDFLIPPDERHVVADKIAPVAAHVVSQDNNWLTKDGRRRLLRWTNAGLVDENGNRTHMIAIGIDITDQQRTLDELRRSKQELIRSNADLEQFAYVASHDLSEPLRAISGPIEFVVQHYQDRPLDDRALEFLGFAVDGARRMREMIDGLLTYSRVDRNEAPLTPVDSGRVVKDVLENLSTMIVEAQAVVVTENDLPVVNGDRSQLASVFQNLISNAVKFVPHDVRPHVSIAAQRDGATWRFTVTDNGIGIPDDLRERAFAMFTRLHPDDGPVGAGIGLAVTKKIIERHGGEIGIEDSPDGTGTQVWFALPAAEAE